MLNLPFLCIILAAAFSTFMSSTMDIITKAKGSGGNSKLVRPKKNGPKQLNKSLNTLNQKVNFSSQQLHTFLSVLLIQEYMYKKMKDAQKCLATLALISAPCQSYTKLYATLEDTEQTPHGCWIGENKARVFKKDTYALRSVEAQLLYEKINALRISLPAIRKKIYPSQVIDSYKKQLEYGQEQRKLFENE